MAYQIIFGQTEEFYAARREKKVYPYSFPLSVESHEEQAQRNHGQSLDRLAQRGGLSPLELWCVFHDKKWNEKGDMTEAKAIEWLGTIDGVGWKIP